jgi:hypothetical protein
METVSRDEYYRIQKYSGKLCVFAEGFNYFKKNLVLQSWKSRYESVLRILIQDKHPGFATLVIDRLTL